MSDHQSDQPKQKTPKGYEIPIPSEAEFENLIKKSATPSKPPLPLRPRRPKK